MSLHAQLTPEAQARLSAQRRNSSITSMIIAMLMVLLIGVLLMLFLLPAVDNFTPEIVSYQASAEEENKPRQKELSRMVQPKPSSPSSSMAKVIAANTVSEIAIPVPETNAEISMDFGNGDDFGEGWGDGDGWGSGGGSTTFFGQKVTAKRVVYVIDYSASMGGQRIQLLKNELTKSVNRMAAGTEYQLIFFAGPAWLAGDQVKMPNHSGAIVVHDKTDYKWVSATKKAHDWDTQGRKQSVDWLEASQEQLNESVKAIKKTKLVWGTAWKTPLEMALNMKPAPDVIFFMTDGLAGGDSEAVARSIGGRAKARKIQLNTIAMMDPRAAKAMRMMAEASGGKFSMVNGQGKVVKNIPKGKVQPPKKKPKKQPKKKPKKK